jgi:hypothetical protein
MSIRAGQAKTGWPAAAKPGVAGDNKTAEMMNAIIGTITTNPLFWYIYTSLDFCVYRPLSQARHAGVENSIGIRRTSQYNNPICNPRKKRHEPHKTILSDPGVFFNT